MIPLDYYIFTQIEQSAKAIVKSMAKAAAFEQHKPDFYKWGEYIYSVLGSEFKRQEQKLKLFPTYFATLISVADHKYISDIYSAQEVSFYIYFLHRKGEPKKLWPRDFHIDGLATIERSDLVLHDHPVWHGLRDEIASYNAIVKHHSEQRRVFLSGIGKICRHYNTLNEALAAWPALNFLLPEWLQTEDLSFDGKPTPLPNDIDVSFLTSLITRVKLEV